MSYLDDYLRNADFRLRRALKEESSYAERFKEQWSRLREVDLEDRAEARKKLRVSGYMVKRMIAYHRMGVEFAHQAIRLRDRSYAPEIRFSGQGNKKLKKLGILAWNIPAGHACPFKGDCFGPCYALHGHYTMNKNLMRTMISNWAATDRVDFASRMCMYLKGTKSVLFRVHDSGDFYDQTYADNWAFIAELNPEKMFYAYTKAFYGLDLSKFERLENFRIIHSVGGAHDSKIDTNKPHARMFPDLDSLEKAEYADGTESESHAIGGTKRIGLVVHGRRKNFFDRERHGRSLK